jgi:nicotinamidase-related amidase
VRDALLLIDLIQRFDHEDGDALLASVRDRAAGIRGAIDTARASEVPVVYVNDAAGRWDSDAPGFVRDAVEHGAGGDVLRGLAPREGDGFLFKARYSVFDHTPLVLLLREREIERVVLAGAATEMCVVQSAIDAKELDFKVTILEDACAAVDGEMERLALAYAERVVGAFVHAVADWSPS